MQENAVVYLYAVNEHVCQPVFPELINGLVVCGFERDAMLHTIGHNAVHGAKQPIEETRYPKMLLGVLQSIFSDIYQILARDTIFKINIEEYDRKVVSFLYKTKMNISAKGN